MKIIMRNPADLIGAEYNPRQLSEKEHQDLTDSIKRFGLADPILVNSNDERKDIVIGGHQRLAISKELGIKEVPTVEHDLTLDKERELNIRLNKNSGSWDMDILANEFDLSDLVDFGFDEVDLGFDLGDDEAEEDKGYSTKIDTPVYTPSMDKPPPLSEMIDTSRCDELIEAIEASSLDKKLKEFLKLCSYRHCKINFANVAEYYSHSNKDEQALFEDNALVVIDYGKAIDDGYTQMLDYFEEKAVEVFSE